VAHNEGLQDGEMREGAYTKYTKPEQRALHEPPLQKKAAPVPQGGSIKTIKQRLG